MPCFSRTRTVTVSKCFIGRGEELRVPGKFRLTRNPVRDFKFKVRKAIPRRVAVPPALDLSP
jgi:hypothetical protein